MLLRRNKTSGLEASLQDLETRRSGVVRRLEACAMRAEEAFAAQRMFLTETDGADAAQAKRLADACRRTSDERAALEDAARVLAEQIADARLALDGERDRKARAEVAGEIEAGAAAIEEAATELDRIAAAFDVARERLMDACQTHAPRDAVTGSGPGFAIITAAARRAGVASRDPDVTALYGGFHVDAAQAAAATVRAMRMNAKAIREGAASSERPTVPPEPVIPAVFPEVQVVLSRTAFYRGFLGKLIELPAGGFSLPEPIAARATELGVGFGPQSVPGAAILRILRTNPAARLDPDGNGSFRGVAFTGALGENGRGIPPAPPPVDLGALPDMHGILAEAAQ